MKGERNMERLKAVRPRDMAIEQIEWYIESNQLKPYTKLLSEREMCELWNINRSTLRAAIGRLVEERVLYSKKGSGTYVAPPRLKRNLQDMKSTSESIKGTGYFMWTEVLESKVGLCDSYLSQKLNIPEGCEVFCLRRLRIRNNTPFMMETSYIRYERCRGIEEHDFSDESLYQVLRNYGIALYEGEESVGITYATEEEAEKLKVETGQYMYYLSGTVKDVKGEFIEFFKSVARVDQIQFSNELKRIE